MGGKRWTEIEINQMTQMVEQGKTKVEIAKVLDRSYASTKIKSLELGLKSDCLDTSDPILIAQLVKFRLAGWSCAKIGLAFGKTQGSISRALSVNGFKRVFKSVKYKYRSTGVKWNELDTHLLRKYCRKGYSLDRICAYFPGRTRIAVREKIRKVTQYWLSAEEQAERLRLRKKRLRVY